MKWWLIGGAAIVGLLYLFRNRAEATGKTEGQATVPQQSTGQSPHAPDFFGAKTPEAQKPTVAPDPLYDPSERPALEEPENGDILEQRGHMTREKPKLWGGFLEITEPSY